MTPTYVYSELLGNIGQARDLKPILFFFLRFSEKCFHCQSVLSFYKVLEAVSGEDVNTHNFFQIKIKMSHNLKLTH